MELNQAACESLCVWVSLCAGEPDTHRKRESPCNCLLRLDEVLVCDFWGRWSNLSFIRPYWAVCRQVWVCVFSIRSIWQCSMGTFVCVSKIHLAGSSLMGCERYCTQISSHALFFSRSYMCPQCIYMYVPYLSTKMTLWSGSLLH